MDRVHIIAEAGVNHNGSLDTALKLVEIAVLAGADAVKFQTFVAENVVTKIAPKADYQIRNTDRNEPQLDMIKRLELGQKEHRAIAERCGTAGIEFLSTPFDVNSVSLLRDLGVKRMKIASGEISNALLLLKIAQTGLPAILSTGMSTLAEVEYALSVLAFGYLKSGKPSISAFREAYRSAEGRSVLRQRVTLLHCTTEYPAPFEEVNLRAMDTLSEAFELPVGLSDHTLGFAISVAAAARGASILEKHFTLDKQAEGPDHRASLDTAELKAMVEAVRQVESAFGDGQKIPSPSESKNRDITRRSLVARSSIREGEPFTEQNLTVRRPGTGVAASQYWDWIGKTADRDYQADELIGEKP